MGLDPEDCTDPCNADDRWQVLSRLPTNGRHRANNQLGTAVRYTHQNPRMGGEVDGLSHRRLSPYMLVDAARV